MDFGLSSAEKELNNEFLEFFEKEMQNAPPAWHGGMDDIFFNDENWAFHVRMARKLGEKGWLALAWPEEYGGLNSSPTAQMLFNEAAGYYRAPGVDMVGVKMIGPVIYDLGTEEQKQEHLKPIAKGERFWCQGWSEPDAGSDLAALTAEGKREGDHYILNGQKVWTTGAHTSDWIFLLVRTDPSQTRSRGLTFLLADMKTPGITVKPILMMNKCHTFNEVFLDDVKIPRRNVIGEENQGWSVVKAISNYERSAGIPVGLIERDLQDLICFCQETKRANAALVDDPLVRDKLAELVCQIEVARAMNYRIASLHESGDFKVAASASSAAKVYKAELYQRLIYTGCEIMGLYSQVKEGSKWAPLQGSFELNYQLAVSWNLAAGSSEIQRNIIGWLALGLPR